MFSDHTNAIEAAFKDEAQLLPRCRDAVKQVTQTLHNHLDSHIAITTLIHERAQFIDHLLQCAWRHFLPADDNIALIAVGGYGRSELHPKSDVDVLLLLAQKNHSDYQQPLEQLLTFLWDIGLEIGHSTRTIDECVDEAKQDITVITNLIEARLLCGPATLFNAMQARIAPTEIWSSADFFNAKEQEQIERHLKYHDAAYNLEPNVKEGPGGLRDLQMISWVTRRYFNSESLEALVTEQFLTHEEYESLIEARDFMWRVRFVLHLHTGRSEDRLLFDYQQTLARAFGHDEEQNNHAVEAFMQRYYIHVMTLHRLNEMLLQHFREVILGNHNNTPVTVNERFQIYNTYLEVTHDDVFDKHPPALLELFLILAQQPAIKGVRASTIRLVRSHLHLVDDEFRNNPLCRELFITLLRQQHGITHQFRRMNRYGLLAAYIPAFGKIVGQMQYDLFHVYTVDEHTLNVLRNVRRFTVAEFNSEFPNCSELSQQLEKPELLYLGALFHDIAKGRGGDHSQLGQEDALAFCRHHGLSEYDANMVAWLVKNHLVMSVTAQRKDISDPDVVMTFAATVKDRRHLDYLYLLTVADIRGTDPKLWNHWKDSLLFNLYKATRQALRRGLENPVDKDELIKQQQQEARTLLRQAEGKALSDSQINTLWQQFGDDYFLRHTIDEITWQTRAIINRETDALPLIATRTDSEHGGTMIFIFTRDEENLFASTAMALDQLNLNVIDARIITARDGHTLNTYVVLEGDGSTIHDPQRVSDISATLKRYTTDPTSATLITRRLPRRLKHFKIPTQVSFNKDPHSPLTMMELITSDRPGLLSLIGKALVTCHVKVHNARIGTFGEKAEDILYISDANDQGISDEAQLEQLRATLIEALGQ